MYGRNNIFSNNNTSSNNGGNYGSYSSSNYSNNYRNTNQRLLGSYRLDYKYEEPPQYLVNCVTQWKESFPSAIVAREETIHFTTTQLRIEDYYLIRKKDLKSIHQNRLREAIRNECFNEEITKRQFPKLPPISEERSLDIDAIRNARSNPNNSNSVSYSRDNETRGNIFSNNSSNNISTNIFSQNSSNRSASNGFSNNSSGNIFTSNKQEGGNIFSNNNTSANRGNVSSSGAYNIFNTNRPSSSNIFTNNNNNYNNNYNNNNNNNGSHNIFGNRNVGNNLFHNNNNNSNNNLGIPPEFLLNFQYVLQQANKIMKAAQQNNHLNQKDEEEQDTRNYLTPLEELAKRDEPLDINYFLKDSRKRPQIQSQTIKLVKPQWFEEYQQLKKSQIHNNQSKVINNSRILNNRSELLSNNGSKLFNNYDKIKNQEIKKTDSRLIGNRHDQALSVRKSTIRMQNTIEEWLGPCICDFQLQTDWEDDDRHQMKNEKIKGKVQMQQMRQKDPEWQKSIVLKLKQTNAIVRSDAQFVVNSCSQKQAIASAQFVIKGRLKQKIINLPATYKSSFSQIKEGMLYNLVISNQYGSICWDKPISAQDLDFAVESQVAPLSIGQNEVICQLDALNTSCRVSFVGLPRYLEQAYSGKEGQFQKQVADFKRFVKQKTNGAFEVIDIWKNQKGSGYISGWTLLATYFPRIEQQVQIS